MTKTISDIRADLVSKKNKVDDDLSASKNKLLMAKRKFSQTGRGMSLVELSNLESKVSRLKFESQEIQRKLAAYNSEQCFKRVTSLPDVFVDLARAQLPEDVFNSILAKARDVTYAAGRE